MLPQGGLPAGRLGSSHRVALVACYGAVYALINRLAPNRQVVSLGFRTGAVSNRNQLAGHKYYIVITKLIQSRCIQTLSAR
jgi:hypothetical protein